MDISRTFFLIALYHANCAQAAAANQMHGVAYDHLAMVIDYLERVKQRESK